MCVEVVLKNCTFYVVFFEKDANLLPFLIGFLFLVYEILAMFLMGFRKSF